MKINLETWTLCPTLGEYERFTEACRIIREADEKGVIDGAKLADAIEFARQYIEDVEYQYSEEIKTATARRQGAE